MTRPYDYGWSTVKQSRRPTSETPQVVIADVVDNADVFIPESQPFADHTKTG